MATSSSKPSAAAAAAVLLALLVGAAVTVAPAEASTLTVFTGPACAGKSKDVNGCGCFDISGYQAGFHFVFTEWQKAILYTGYNCDPHYPYYSLDKETRLCVHNNFKSVEMIC